jgi:4-amino-4-deoxy-L-arabinose transferase-like glycosyltransferase
MSADSLNSRPWRALMLVLILAAPLFLAVLDAPLLEPQEPRYAEIPRQMLEQGRWLVPVLHGQEYLDKPPLLYWSVMASYGLFGVHDWSARLVPGVAGLLTVLVVYGWGLGAGNARTGLLAALVLCLSARFVYLERMLTMDSLLCLWVCGALAAGHLAQLGPQLRWRWWQMSALACGLGLLTKGPVALVLVLPPLLAARLLDRRCAWPGWRAGATYLAISLAVAGPWYLAVVWTTPDFAGYFFWKHNVVRFLTPFDHAEPFWFFVPDLLRMLPWTLLLPGLVTSLARPASKDGPLGFFLLAFAWGFIFFSLAGCKRHVYIVPALPPLALALGGFLASLSFSLRAARWWIAVGTLAYSLQLLAVLMLLPAYNQRFALRDALVSIPGPDSEMPISVICYPQMYDSVPYYLPRSAVTVYRADQWRQLLEDLHPNRRILLVVKSREVLAELTANVAFEAISRQGTFTVGWVWKKPEDR